MSPDFRSLLLGFLNSGESSYRKVPPALNNWVHRHRLSTLPNVKSMNRIAKQVTVFAAVVLAVTLLSKPVLSQETHPNHGLLKPGLNYEQRIELAKKLLEPARIKATTDLSSDERKSSFVQHWAEIDPAWTAKFILENPVTQTGSPDEWIPYDAIAIRALMKRPTEIKKSDLLKLFNHDLYGRMAVHYAAIAIDNLPAENTEPKEEIIKLGTSAPTKDSPVYPTNFGSQIKLAKKSSDPTVLKRVEERIDDFYKSGEAMKMWNLVKKEKHFETNREFHQSCFKHFAPEAYREKFGAKLGSFSNSDIYVLVHDDFVTLESKRKQLRQIKTFSFGDQPHDQISGASTLGLIATIDCELALKWAEQAPAEHVKIWSKLAIAPSLNRKNPAAARQMIRECYDQILTLDDSNRNRYNYNSSPTTIATQGLQVVKFVDPSLLPTCIDKTILTIKPLDSTHSFPSKDQVFHAIAAIASFDRVKAETIFEKHADDVSIGYSVSFFRAMLALHPDQVWDELQEMPAKDSSGTNYHTQVLNEIVPALTKKSDEQFWQQLNWSGFFSLDPKIFATED